MKLFRIVGISLAITLASCELISFEDWEIPPYDGDFSWTKVTAHAQWKDRLDFAAVAFQDKLWVFGGYNPGERSKDPYYEDVWSSVDGKDWELIQGDAPWKGRRGHTVTVFNDGSGDALYLAGGFSVDEATGYRQYNNDVWKSADGANWQLVKERTYHSVIDSLADWFPRMNHAMVARKEGNQDYLYLIGGSTMLESGSARYSMKYFNDAWRSSDGIHWENLHCNDYGIRAGHAACIDPISGRIYVQGGIHGLIFEGTNNQAHPRPDWQWLWSSEDGIHWTPESDTVSFEQGYLYRTEHQIAFYNNTLYTFPGATNSTGHFHFAQTTQVTMWKQQPGNLWSIDSKGSDINARYSYGFIQFDEKIWILGGDTNANGPSNDVWHAEIN